MPQLDWNATINSVRESLPPTQFQNWLGPLKFLRADDRAVVLGVPNRFHEEWVRANYGSQLMQAIREQCGLDLTLEFEVCVTKENVEAARSPVTAMPHVRPNLRIVDSSTPEEDEQIHVEPPNCPSFSQNFLELEYNHVAYQCANLFADGSDQQINPLVVVGGTGMGKTHLLSTIGQRLHEVQSTSRIRYTNSESFTSEMVQSFNNKTHPFFRKKYWEQTECLLFDDVQGLAGRRRTQEELLHAFNEIIGRGGRIAFTSSVAMHRLEEFIDPLKSRLLSGVIVEIKPPTFEERVDVLKQTCALNQIEVDEIALRTLADQGQKDIRELIGTLFRVHLQAKLENRKLTSDFLATEGWARDGEKEEITLAEIISLVEYTFNVSRTELHSKSRKSLTAWARQVAMYLARCYTALSLDEIGKTFGRDHATVIHAYQKVTDSMKNQHTRRYEVEFLKQKLQSRMAPRPPNVPI